MILKKAALLFVFTFSILAASAGVKPLTGDWSGGAQVVEIGPTSQDVLFCKDFGLKVVQAFGRLRIEFNKESFNCGDKYFYFDDLEYWYLDGKVIKDTEVVGEGNEKVISIFEEVCPSSLVCEKWEMARLELDENKNLVFEFNFDHESSSYRLVLEGILEKTK